MAQEKKEQVKATKAAAGPSSSGGRRGAVQQTSPSDETTKDDEQIDGADAETRHTSQAPAEGRQLRPRVRVAVQNTMAENYEDRMVSTRTTSILRLNRSSVVFFFASRRALFLFLDSG